MDEQTHATPTDTGRIAEAGRALMVATADLAGEQISATRKRLAAALEPGTERYGRVREKAVHGPKAAGEAVQEHSYRAIGIARGVGPLIAGLAARRCSCCGD